LTALKVATFYAPSADDRHTTLWKGGEFSLTDNSKIFVREVGQLKKYPQENLYPPYWRYLETVKPKEVELGMFKLIYQ